jgi:hypothetical protein
VAVYILHFDKPFHHSRHYVGWAKEPTAETRINHHHNGTSGVRYIEAALAAGVTFRVARIWPDASRNFERQLKNTHSTADYCPICHPIRYREFVPEY